MTEYTKGPWAWKVGVDDNQNKEWRLSPGILITSCTDGTPWGDNIDKANARLISAAPDMLELIEEAESILTMTGFRLYEDIIMRMRLVIAKAKGIEKGE